MYDYIAHWQAQQAEAVCQKLLWSHQVNCLCLCVMPFILPACSVRTHSCVIKREGKTEAACVRCSMFGLLSPHSDDRSIQKRKWAGGREGTFSPTCLVSSHGPKTCTWGVLQTPNSDSGTWTPWGMFKDPMLLWRKIWCWVSGCTIRK